MHLADLYFYIHMVSLGCAAVGILYADHLAFDWLRGKKETLLRAHLLRAHHSVSFALAALIGSGLLMFWPVRDYLMHQPAFWVKMGFVGALLINSFAIEYLMHAATSVPFKSLPTKQKVPLFISGTVSLGSWLGAGTAAFFLFP